MQALPPSSWWASAFLFAGLKLDEWLKFKMPVAVWVLPLLFIVVVIVKIIRDTGNKK